MTGATGLIGSKWLQRLLAVDPDRHITVLTRTPSHVLECKRITVLAADLTAPHLGLSNTCRRALADSIIGIIHCAADIRFGLPLSQARDVNARGTSKLLELARSCRHLEKFAHISTVYVAGRCPGRLPETLWTNTAGFFNTYQQSKYEAEELVARAMPDIPAAVFRVSSIIGDSVSGRVEQFNYFHQLLKFVPRNPLPVMPGIPDAPVDLIASDWAVAALSALYESSFEPGSFYNLSAGPSNSLTVREIVKITFDQVCHCGSPSIETARIPELVSVEEFDRFVHKNMRGKGSICELVGRLAQFLPHLAIRQHFENDRTLATLAARAVRLPSIRSYYPKVIQYCLDSHWGHNSATTGHIREEYKCRMTTT